ncbi:hypothetical protein BIU88_08755 [Chlorobaculum limnaeum]|uniref:Lcl C-terminal domain-containing protein n=1 Tax=Chlorobaculum limnaeum TaxID=274537 RepID=A0A1D8CZ82_CHLLM|nr:DUF1566 domain-containing protein [Chlorobaculum limnaeum]AOS84212.1 hypothetical protein BIU88_08755 [Chlorobaculum limnaeum]
MRYTFKSVIDWRHVFIVFALLSAVARPSQAEAVEIGQRYAGGVVFNVDESGRHGLVAATRDLPGNNYDWQQAKEACGRFVHNGYSDWYLPSKWELSELYKHKWVVGGFADDSYWSSTEVSAHYAWLQYFVDGGQTYFSKGSDNFRVRPVRAF